MRTNALSPSPGKGVARLQVPGESELNCPVFFVRPEPLQLGAGRGGEETAGSRERGSTGSAQCPEPPSAPPSAEPAQGTLFHRPRLCPSTCCWAAKSLQSCPTLCDPIDGSPPGSPGFFRQEHWSGLPFPSPMHESEKRK